MAPRAVAAERMAATRFLPILNPLPSIPMTGVR